MNEHTEILPTHEQIKTQAKRLRAELAQRGTDLNHSQSLELIAHQHGFKNWNTMRAATGETRPMAEWQLGQTIRGHYMSQPFTGKLLSISQRKHINGVQLTIQFDEAVNVSQFESMIIQRHRVTSQIDQDGKSPEKTSNGVPIMQIDL